MIITDEARDMIKELLKQNQCNCIQVHVIQSCCSSSLEFEMIKTESKDIIMFNDIPFQMDFEARVMTKSKIIEVENSELMINNQ